MSQATPPAPPSGTAPRLPSLAECGLFVLIAVALMFGMLTGETRISEGFVIHGLNLNGLANNLGSTVPLFVLLCVTALMARRLGHSFKTIEEAMRTGIGLALPAILILIVVGGLIGVWIGSGTISTLIWYGLDLLSPEWFLPATLLLCSVVSLACGSSWTTAGTMGIALIGMGRTLGLDPAMVAGAVVSGAYFGDKLSPLSDTTNLAPAIAGTDLFSHIHSMLFTTVPAYLLALGIYTWIGLSGHGATAVEASDIAAMQGTLEQLHHVSPWLLLPPVVVLVLAVMKQPALPSLVVGVLVAAVMSLLLQGGAAPLRESLTRVSLQFLQGFVATSGNAGVDKLLSNGGMESMLPTILLVTVATAMGGVLEKARYLDVLMAALQRRVKRAAGLVTSTILSCAGANALLSDQYLSIVLPGRLFRAAYPKFGISPRVLSRSLEDAGTLTSPLFGWNSCGAYMAVTLGVATGDYWRYAFFNLLNPLVAILFAWTGWFVFRHDPAKEGSGNEPPAPTPH
ncbi:MAG: Na+/H+ antiporter NhaC [Planctomycetes bacterium]|nr:Na+/H+ antiporter NhaC [Planctomycetota bacterium]